jgi:phosphocarrier protein HPr
MNNMEKEFYITNEQGVHARPATLLVGRANQYKCDVTVTFEGNSVDLKSIMGVLSLGISKGSTISIEIKGVDEEEALQGITQMINELNNQ